MQVFIVESISEIGYVRGQVNDLLTGVKIFLQVNNVELVVRHESHHVVKIQYTELHILDCQPLFTLKIMELHHLNFHILIGFTIFSESFVLFEWWHIPNYPNIFSK